MIVFSGITFHIIWHLAAAVTELRIKPTFVIGLITKRFLFCHWGLGSVKSWKIFFSQLFLSLWVEEKSICWNAVKQIPVAFVRLAHGMFCTITFFAANMKPLMLYLLCQYWCQRNIVTPQSSGSGGCWWPWCAVHPSIPLDKELKEFAFIDKTQVTLTLLCNLSSVPQLRDYTDGAHTHTHTHKEREPYDRLAW